MHRNTCEKLHETYNRFAGQLLYEAQNGKPFAVLVCNTKEKQRFTVYPDKALALKFMRVFKRKSLTVGIAETDPKAQSSDKAVKLWITPPPVACE